MNHFPSVLRAVILIVCVLVSSRVAAVVDISTERASYTIDFPINSHNVAPAFSRNWQVLDSLRATLAAVQADPFARVDSIRVEGYASPDGSVKFNLALAQKRTDALARWIVSNCDVSAELVHSTESAIAWADFRREVEKSGMPASDRILKICERGSDHSQTDVARRMARLKALDGGKVWRTLAREIFPGLRRSVSVLVMVHSEQPAAVVEPEPEAEPERVIEPEPVEVPDSVVESIPEPKPVKSENVAHVVPACRRGWHVSSNLVGWGMFIANVTGEYDFGCRWSAALSLYYSAWNYCTSTRKFRTFIFRPEVRYWFADDRKGFFVDGHLSMVSYNFALKGWDYRIQDVDGKRPALGGGIGAGWRVPLSDRWSAEAQVGVGCYALKYNRFENRPNGQLVDTRRRTWFGIDNVAISLVYNF